MSDDLTEARRQILAQGRSATAFVEQSIAAAGQGRVAPSFVATSFDAARAVLDAGLAIEDARARDVGAARPRG